jgi:hypothetical protein
VRGGQGGSLEVVLVDGPAIADRRRLPHRPADPERRSGIGRRRRTCGRGFGRCCDALAGGDFLVDLRDEVEIEAAARRTGTRLTGRACRPSRIGAQQGGRDNRNRNASAHPRPPLQRFCLIVTLKTHRGRIGNYRPAIEPAPPTLCDSASTDRKAMSGFSILRASRVGSRRQPQRGQRGMAPLRPALPMPAKAPLRALKKTPKLATNLLLSTL